MSVAAPELTADARAAALRKATSVRMARRKFKDSVAAGEIPLGLAIERAKGNEALAGIRVRDLLQCVRGIGPARAEALMEELGIARSRRVRGLGYRQTAGILRKVKR